MCDSLIKNNNTDLILHDIFIPRNNAFIYLFYSFIHLMSLYCFEFILLFLYI